MFIVDSRHIWENVIKVLPIVYIEAFDAVAQLGSKSLYLCKEAYERELFESYKTVEKTLKERGMLPRPSNFFAELIEYYVFAYSLNDGDSLASSEIAESRKCANTNDA